TIRRWVGAGRRALTVIDCWLRWGSRPSNHRRWPEVPCQAAEPVRMPDRATVAQEREPRANVVARPVAVPHDRDVMPVIAHVIEREVRPVGWCERIDLERIVGSRAESRDSCDDQ